MNDEIEKKNSDLSLPFRGTGGINLPFRGTGGIPIVQAGMIWASGWRLASAVSNAGALGMIGAGSMYPEVLRDHIRKCRAATNKPFAVNVLTALSRFPFLLPS